MCGTKTKREIICLTLLQAEMALTQMNLLSCHMSATKPSGTETFIEGNIGHLSGLSSDRARGKALNREQGGLGKVLGSNSLM